MLSVYTWSSWLDLFPMRREEISLQEHLDGWENGYCESFHSRLRDKFLNGEIFYSMNELRVRTERWRVHYNTVRPRLPELRNSCATLTISSA